MNKDAYLHFSRAAVMAVDSLLADYPEIGEAGERALENGDDVAVSVVLRRGESSRISRLVLDAHNGTYQEVLSANPAESSLQ